jgi:hypothetical protein
MRNALYTALGLCALQGCIIYEVRDCEGPKCDVWEGGVDDTGAEVAPGGGWVTTPGVQEEPGLFLTVTEGHAGDTVLTMLGHTGPFDLAKVEEVTFSGPIEVVDMVLTEDELVLLLAIDPTAKPGDIDVLVDHGLDITRLDAPFVVVDPMAEPEGCEETTTTAPTDTGEAPPTIDTAATQPDDTGTEIKDDGPADSGDTGDCP